ncbi:MAG: TlpA family protein disulfide reductase [Sedimenticola sp.]|nr:TlpA family protein disulfide reductase [Sedimenticola sp.]
MKYLKPALLLLTCLLLGTGPLQAGRLLSVVEDRPKAPDFTLNDVHGKPVSLADFGGRVLVINFWATWCPSCRKEMPSLERAADWLKQYDAALIGVNVGERPNQVHRYLAEEPVDFPILLDPDMKMSTEWGATRLPVTYVVDPEGRIVYRALGSREWDAPELLVPIRSLGLDR